MNSQLHECNLHQAAMPMTPCHAYGVEG